MTSTLGDKEYNQIRKIVYERSRIELGPNKRELVAARVNKRLRALGLQHYSDYCRLIASADGVGELGELVDVISTNHTFFFRESKHFEFLTQVLLPEVVSSNLLGPQDTFRVWSAASSTGEEAYSVAMTLEQHLNGVLSHRDWMIEGTDISTRVLAHAREGIYATDRVKGIPADLLRRYFQRGVGTWDGYYRVKDEIRRKVRFQHLNLLESRYPFTASFHLILCRNVMIYFDRSTQQELVERLAGQLVPGGVLMIGHSESLNAIKHRLRMIQPAVFRLEGRPARR